MKLIKRDTAGTNPKDPESSHRLERRGIYPIEKLAGRYCHMSSALGLHSLALKIPQRPRLKLAVELLRSATPAASSLDVLYKATQSDAELESSKVTALTESEFWASITRSDNRI